MPLSAAIWRMLPPWQNLNNGSMVTIWPCMPGFHRCSLGLHTSTCKLTKQPVMNEVPQCPFHRSVHFWLTALPLAIVFSILLVSIAAQEFSVQGRTQLQPQTSDQRVHIGFPEGTAFSSSWGLLTGNLERLLQIRWFASNGMRSNYNSANRNDEGSSEAKRIEAEQTQARLEQSTLSGVDVNRADLPLRSQPREVSAKSQGYRQPNNQDLNQENTLSRHQAIQLKLPKFRQLTSLPNKTYCDAAAVKNADCGSDSQGNLCSERYVHIAMTLDVNYLRGSMAAIYSILLHAACPSNIRFHFVATDGKEELEKVVADALPFLQFQTYAFDEKSVKHRISHAVRHALEEPLNYARFYLAHMIDPCVKRIIYLDSDVLVLDRIEGLWMTDMGSATVATPEYCHANFASYLTGNFWTNATLSATFANKHPCYFNSGVMVINLDRWRETHCTATLEYWMEVQKEQHIYDLGSLPPLLLTFAGDIQPIDHRWNQHGLGGDILKGDCRPPRNEPASLLHWSGGGKPWQRVDIQQPCPVDNIWVQYDLLEPWH